MLLAAWLDITAAWRPAFRQSRSFSRALCQALGILTAFGRRTLSRALWAEGRQLLDWSADYRLHARAAWRASDLFQSILQKALPFCPGRFVSVAIDDTRLHKTGRRILSAFFQRDPISPKFRFNLMFGLRFLQFSLLVPLYRSSQQPARALPVRFEEVPALKHPGSKASPQLWAAFRQQQKQQNLSTHTVASLRDLRTSLDAAGYSSQCLLAVCDNSFCNRTIFRAELTNTAILARARRDIKLCRRATGCGSRFYGEVKFTPKQVYDDQSISWQQARIFHGGQWRQVRYKEVTDVYWQSASGRRPLRLLVVARIPYQVPGRERKNYGDPAFLLTTDFTGTPEELLQAYFDRWQIGVSSQGHIVQSVKDRPRPKDSGLVAGEASWRESKTAEPSDNILGKECAQRTRLQRAVNADVASLHESPVAETVDNARKQQELTETSPIRQLSPAGYQRRHGVKEDVETGEALGARRRNLVEEMPAITVSGKCGHRRQGDGSGRITGDGRAAKRARREGPGPASTPLTKARQG